MKHWTRSGTESLNSRYFTEDFKETSEQAFKKAQESEVIGSGGCFVAGTMIHVNVSAVVVWVSESHQVNRQPRSLW